jgi:uncharacterized protein
MIQRLGISIYPQKQSFNEMKRYIEVAAKAGFTRLFVAFLGVEPKRETIEALFKEILFYARDLGFDVTADVHPQIIKALATSSGLMQMDLQVFKDMGVDTLRLDLGFSEFEEALMSRNRAGLRLELNMSFETAHVESLIKLGAQADRIWGCHNYYPQRYTGLSQEFFNQATALWERLNLNTAAFIGTQEGQRIGPWPITEGLVTLESHRDLDVVVQFEHYLALKSIKDVLFGDIASENELNRVGALLKDRLSLPIELSDGLPEDYLSILNRSYSRRPDLSGHLIRTFEGRFIPSSFELKPFNTVDIEVGDVLVCNDLYGQYKGELQIALQALKNDGKRNVLGRVRQDAQFLIEYLKAGDGFGFII